MAQNWDIDPKNGDYLLQGGSPIETDSLKVPAYYRLKISAGSWLYAPSNTFGSTFNLIKRQPTGRDANKVENAAAVALQPILDDGRAVSIAIDTVRATRGAVGLTVKIQRQRGVFDQLELPSVGV